MPPIPPLRQLNVRLPPDLIEQIDDADRSNQDVVAAALRAYFDDSRVLSDDSSENGGGRDDDNRNDSMVLSPDSSMIAALTGQLDTKDRQIAAKDHQLEAKDEQLTATLVLLHDAITPPLQLLDHTVQTRQSGSVRTPAADGAAVGGNIVTAGASPWRASAFRKAFAADKTAGVEGRRKWWQFWKR